MKKPNTKLMKKTKRMYMTIGGVCYALTAIGFLQYDKISHEYMWYNSQQKLDEFLNRAINPLTFFNVTPISTSALGTIAIATILGGVAVFMMVGNAKDKKTDEHSGGSAEIMNDADIKDHNLRFAAPLGKPGFDSDENMIMTSEIRLALYTKRPDDRNCNTIVFGAPGTGKSFTLIGPNLLQANSTYIVTDPAGELLQQYGKYLEDKGYAVKVFNLSNMRKSNHYNPFRYIHSESDVFTLVNTLIQNTTDPKKSGGDDFWVKSETALLCALIMYLWKHAEDDRDKCFTTVMKLLRAADIDENDQTNSKSKLDLMFDEVRKKDENDLSVKQYDTFKMAAGKTAKSILISCGVRLQHFDLEEVHELTSTDDIDLEHVADRKTAIFVVTPTGTGAFNFLASMMYSQLFMRLYDYGEQNIRYTQRIMVGDEMLQAFQAKDEEEAKEVNKNLQKMVDSFVTNEVVYNEKYHRYDITNDEYGVIAWRGDEKSAKDLAERMKKATVDGMPKGNNNKVPIRVQFLLDEYANISGIPEFPQKLSTVRKYNISAMMILQTLGQLKQRHKDEYGALIGDCDSLIFLGGQDLDTNKYLSELFGKQTVKARGQSYQSGGNGGGSTSINNGSKELFAPNELASMDRDTCIYLLNGEKPYWGPKYTPFNHPGFKHSQETSGTFVINSDENSSFENFNQSSIDSTMKSLYEKDRKKQDMKEEDRKKFKEEIKQKNEENRRRSENIKRNKNEDGTDIVSEISSLSEESSTALSNVINKLVESISTSIDNDSDLSERSETVYSNNFGPDEMDFESMAPDKFKLD